MNDDEKRERKVKNLMMFLIVLHQEHDILEEIIEKGTSRYESNSLHSALKYLKIRIEHYRGIIKSIN